MNKKYDSDKDILTGLKQRDEVALDCCINKYTSYVSYIVGNIIGERYSKADYEELIADVFITVWEKAELIDLEQSDAFKAYIGAIARNKSRNKLRQLNKVRDFAEIDDSMAIGDSISVEGHIISEELQDIIIRCIKQLSPDEQKCFIKYYYYRLTVKAVAEDLSLNESTVKSKLARGREKLKKMIIEEVGSYDDIDY